MRRSSRRRAWLQLFWPLLMIFALTVASQLAPRLRLFNILSSPQPAATGVPTHIE